MAFENIQIEHGNFTIRVFLGVATAVTMDHDANTMIEKTLAGEVVFNYILDTDIIEVQSLQWDGFYFWSLEKQGLAGFRVRKWEIDSGNVVRAVGVDVGGKKLDPLTRGGANRCVHPGDFTLIAERRNARQVQRPVLLELAGALQNRGFPGVQSALVGRDRGQSRSPFPDQEFKIL